MTEGFNEHLRESLKQLAGDVRFKVYMAEIREMREAAITEGTQNLQNLAAQGTAYAALGEIRAYTNLINLVKEYEEKADDIPLIT
jgi:hypothetical protein